MCSATRSTSVRRCRSARRADHAAHVRLEGGWTGPEGHVAWAPAQQGHGLPESWLAEGLTLRFRAGGERFQPRGRQHHHSLKDLFQESGVVPWMRERVPLLYRGATLVAIGDLWVSADVDARSGAGAPLVRAVDATSASACTRTTLTALLGEASLREASPRGAGRAEVLLVLCTPVSMHQTLNFDGRTSASAGSGVRSSRF